jgi:hypothetical protein
MATRRARNLKLIWQRLYRLVQILGQANRSGDQRRLCYRLRQSARRLPPASTQTPVLADLLCRILVLSRWPQGSCRHSRIRARGIEIQRIQMLLLDRMRHPVLQKNLCNDL